MKKKLSITIEIETDKPLDMADVVGHQAIWAVKDRQSSIDPSPELVYMSYSVDEVSND